MTLLERVELSDFKRILLPATTLNCTVHYDLMYDSIPNAIDITFPIYGRYLGFTLDITSGSVTIVSYLLVKALTPNHSLNDYSNLVKVFHSADYFLVVELNFSKLLPGFYNQMEEIGDVALGHGWRISKDGIPKDLLPRND